MPKSVVTDAKCEEHPGFARRHQCPDAQESIMLNSPLSANDARPSTPIPQSVRTSKRKIQVKLPKSEASKKKAIPINVE